MVSNRNNNGGNSGAGNSARPIIRERRIISNHNIDHDAIRELLRGCLDPLPLSTIPTSVHIGAIVVAVNSEGKLTLRCQVSFETRV